MLNVPEMRKYEVDLILRGYKSADHYIVSTAGYEVQRAIGRQVLLALEHGPADIDIIAERVQAELVNNYRAWSLHVVIGAMTRLRMLPYTSCQLIRRGDSVFIEMDWFASIA